MAPEHVISHSVGTLYTFSETAGREVISLFKKNSISDTKCHFHDGNIFTIGVSHNDNESLVSILNSVQYFVSMSKYPQPGLFVDEDEKVTRTRGTVLNSTRSASTDMRIQAVKRDGERPLIEFKDIIRIWSPSSEVKSKFSLPLMERIGDLCRCRIEHDCDSTNILIKAGREQDVERSISKLELLNKMMIDEKSFPNIHSFYILEGEVSDSLRLVAFKDLHDNRPATILLDNDCPVESLRDLYFRVITKGADILQINFEPSTSIQECRLWNEYVQSCDHARGLIATKGPRWPETPIDRWVSEVTDADVQVDVFRPDCTVEMQQSLGVEAREKEPSSPTRKTITRRARTARGNPDAISKTFSEAQHRHDDKEASLQRNIANFIDDQTTGIGFAMREGKYDRRAPCIEPPYMPPLAMSSHSRSTTLSSTSKQAKSGISTWSVVVQNSKSGNLVDLSVPNEERVKDGATVVMDNLQDTTGAKDSEVKYTVHQKKASGQSFMELDTTIVKSFEKAITHLLVLGLSRTGRIGFAVDIGRLFMKRQCDLLDSNSQNFKTSEFLAGLAKDRPTGFESIFTNVFTKRSSEAESILNIPLSPGKWLFRQQPASRKVTYVFSCKAKGGDQIVVELDGHGNFSIHGTEILMGTLDWHFPKRTWDARLRLTSERCLATDHQRQVRSILDNLKIGVSESAQSLELWTQTINDDLIIESIILRRETLHPVTLRPDLMLHLTESQDLQVGRASGSGTVYTGTIQASKIMIKTNRLWWTAKISSLRVSAILKENNSLELGERASWSPSSLLKKGFVRDLFDTTKEIVTRIDHIGFFNQSGHRTYSKTTEQHTGNTQGLSANMSRVDAGFW